MHALLKSVRVPATAVALACLSYLGAAQAVPVAPGGALVPLPGTTSAAEPSLAGVVLQDVLSNWESPINPMYGFPGAEGTLQSRVVQETGTGTLDFYWRLTVSQPSYPNDVPTQFSLSGLSLADFLTGGAFDANYRLDGLGNVAPTGAFASADGSAFTYQFGASSFGPGTSTYFLLLHSNATDYAKTAFATFGATTVGTFAPVTAVPEPSTYALMLAGLSGFAFIARRRRAARAVH